MTRFRYRAATGGGEVVEGVLQAPSQHGALEELRRQRLYPMAIEPVAAGERGRSREETLGRADALALWTRTMATLLGAGITLDRALAFAGAQSANVAVADAVRQVRDAVRGGASLADGMRRAPRAFGALYVAMVAAGEESGALDQVFARLADYLDETRELRAQLRAALMYPLLMAAVATVGVLVLLFAVVPRFAAMLAEVGGTLPMSTRILVATSHVVVGGWWAWLPLLVVAALLARRWLGVPANRARWHAARLRWPLVGPLERKLATARFARTFGLLLRSGLAVLPALRIARTAVENLALGNALDRAAEDVSQGRGVAAAMTGVLPPLATQLIAAGEETGRLDELALRTADGYDADVRRSLRMLVGLVEPVLILLFGALVGFVALAMLQAIYSVNAGRIS